MVGETDLEHHSHGIPLPLIRGHLAAHEFPRFALFCRPVPGHPPVGGPRILPKELLRHPGILAAKIIVHEMNHPVIGGHPVAHRPVAAIQEAIVAK